MNKKIIPLVLLASTILLTACNEKKPDNNNTPVISKEDSVAVVNGKYISKATLAGIESELNKRQPGQSFPKEKLVEELIQRELLLQEALKKKLDKTVKYTTQLETIKTGLLTQAAVEDFLKSNPITDADIKAEYDKNVAASGTEYKARHILVKTEEEANNIIAELSKGADFAELAKTKSTGPSGPQGGDLGWFAAGQMVAPFSEAVIALEDNKFTLTPVKTQFGYHVILREGSRAQTPPPFESVKERIRPMLQRKKMQSFLTELRQQAKVEILLPKAIPAPAPVAKPATAVKSAVDNASTTVTDAAEQTKSAAEDATKDIANKVSELVKTTTDNAKSAVAETIEKTDKAVADKISSSVDALTK
ncbi:MAG: peptidylprolyl isomerase [Methylococcales bacterium]